MHTILPFKRHQYTQAQQTKWCDFYCYCSLFLLASPPSLSGRGDALTVLLFSYLKWHHSLTHKNPKKSLKSQHRPESVSSQHHRTDTLTQTQRQTHVYNITARPSGRKVWEMANCHTKITQIKSHTFNRKRNGISFIFFTMLFLQFEFGAWKIFNERKSLAWIYMGMWKCFEWMKFEKLRQSERCLLLFLCLFRPLSKALLKFSCTQPSHFCTQIGWLKQQQRQHSAFPPRFVFPRFACMYVHDSTAQTLSICAVWYRESAFSSFVFNEPNSLEATPPCVCIQSTMHCCNARTVIPMLTPQHTEFQCVFAINSQNHHVMDTSGWYCFQRKFRFPIHATLIWNGCVRALESKSTDTNIAEPKATGDWIVCAVRCQLSLKVWKCLYDFVYSFFSMHIESVLTLFGAQHFLGMATINTMHSENARHFRNWCAHFMHTK